MTLDAAIREIETKKESILNGLIEILRIPSVSTLPMNKNDVERTAKWIASRLEKSGFSATVYPTKGHPIVFAGRQNAGKNAPTLLVYGHYDVQPAEPLEEWITPAFEPAVRGDNLYARGASDMKGQLMAHISAVECMLQAGELPINVKYIVEGEEEIGSPNLEEFISQQSDLLKADVILNGDTMMVTPDLPTIIYGLRGLAYFELRIRTAEHDLHSGLFGGGVLNAGQVLCELIAGMHDAKGRVTLPGFYDDVIPLEESERRELARVPFEEKEFFRQATVRAMVGEEGFTTVERLGARPTLEVNGLLCGFTGEGSKTVLPAQAMAKISMRLVPHQDPKDIHEQLKRYIETHIPPGAEWELLDLAGGPAAIVRRDTKEMQAALQALEDVFSVKPVFYREGGSVPVVSLMQKYLKRDSLLMGFGLPDDNIHAPNEKLFLPNFFKGIEVYIRFAYGLAESK